MQEHLLSYLFQFGQVNIPGSGTLQLNRQPAQIDVAEKKLSAPFFSLRWLSEEPVSHHQLHYLQQQTGNDSYLVQQQLSAFGQQVRDGLNNGGYQWAGLGLLNKKNEIELRPSSLQPIAAEKVIRTGADHALLVGDRETTSAQMADSRMETAKEHRSVFVLVGWVLLVLSLVLIAYFLYTGKFKITAAGSRQKVVAHSMSRHSISSVHTASFISPVQRTFAAL